MRSLGRWTAAALIAVVAAWGQPRHGERPAGRLIVRGAMVVEGTGTPAQGPFDLVLEGGKIVQIAPGAAARPGDQEIDAHGKYVLPGFINLHGHLHNERGGLPMDPNYVLKLWLACGITTVRDLGSALTSTLEFKAKGEKGEAAAPHLLVYPTLGRPATAEAAARRVAEIRERGADGLKIVGAWRDAFIGATDAARAAGLPVAIHIGVEEINARDAIAQKVRSIEHWYGIPDAALAEGGQNFPSTYNYRNEADRFRYAGRLWRETDPARLGKVLDGMIEAGVAWDPTLAIYEAARDLQRAQAQPWFGEYLHPALRSFFQPNLENHGSFYLNWSSTDEAFWKENYRLWMGAVREFGRRGGLIGMGEDAGYIYQMYGFGMLRNFELHQEAGFHPLEIVRQATSNGARILGQESVTGRVRAGWAADLVIVNGNPLEDFKVLYPVRPHVGSTGGIEWTIKGGIPYHVPRLMGEVKAIVEQARRKP